MLTVRRWAISGSAMWFAKRLLYVIIGSVVAQMQLGGGDSVGSVVKKRRKKIARHKYRKMRRAMKWQKKRS